MHAVLLTLSLLAGCGDGEADSSSTPQRSVPGTVSVEGTLAGLSVFEDGEVSRTDFEATIAQAELTIRLPGPDGSILGIILDTAARRIPGSIAADHPAVATLEWIVGADRYPSVGAGTVVISDCPKQIGDRVRGEVRGVTVAASDGTREGVDLRFEVVVSEVRDADIQCGTSSGPVDEGDPEDEPLCSAGTCADPHSGCCPYRDCLNTCAVACRLDPCTGETAGACGLRCRRECIDNCRASSCTDVVDALWLCQSESGCFDAGAAEERVCTQTDCCEELRAAY